MPASILRPNSRALPDRGLHGLAREPRSHSGLASCHYRCDCLLRLLCSGQHRLHGSFPTCCRGSPLPLYDPSPFHQWRRVAKCVKCRHPPARVSAPSYHWQAWLLPLTNTTNSPPQILRDIFSLTAQGHRSGCRLLSVSRIPLDDSVHFRNDFADLGRCLEPAH